MHQPVRRQAKTQSRAACCWNCSIFEPRVWQNVWVKRVIKFVQNSPSHFIIPLTFLCSFSLSSPLFPLSFSAFDPRTSWCSAEGVFFSPFSAHRIDLCLLDHFFFVSFFLRLPSLLCSLVLGCSLKSWEFTTGSYGSFGVGVITHCKLWIYSVQWK